MLMRGHEVHWFTHLLSLEESLRFQEIIVLFLAVSALLSGSRIFLLCFKTTSSAIKLNKRGIPQHLLTGQSCLNWLDLC